jgi:hypothetical protein
VPISVNADFDAGGDITLDLTSSNPAVGTVFKVLNFANNYLGAFADIDIPLLDSGYSLVPSLISSGLSFAVTADESSSSAERAITREQKPKNLGLAAHFIRK